MTQSHMNPKGNTTPPHPRDRHLRPRLGLDPGYPQREKREPVGLGGSRRSGDVLRTWLTDLFPFSLELLPFLFLKVEKEKVREYSIV